MLIYQDISQERKIIVNINLNTSKLNYNNFRLPFKFQVSANTFLSDNTLDDEYKAHEIKFNFNSSCKLEDATSGYLRVETSSDGKFCLITHSVDTSSFHNAEPIKIKLQSQSKGFYGSYNKQSQIDILYHSGFITPEEFIELSSNDRSIIVKILEPHSNNELSITSNTSNLINLKLSESETREYLQIEVPENVDDDFESTIKITDTALQETQEIKVKFTKYTSWFSSVNFVDVLLLLIFLIFLFVLILWCIGGEEKINRKSYNFKAPAGSKGFMRLNEQ